MRDGKRGPWLGCSGFPKCRGRADWKALGEAKQKALLVALERHGRENLPKMPTHRDGRPVEAGVPVADLILPESVVRLDVHPDAAGGEQPISPYRASEAIAAPFVAHLREPGRKRAAGR